ERSNGVAVSTDGKADEALIELSARFLLQFVADHLQAAVVNLPLDLHQLTDRTAAGGDRSVGGCIGSCLARSRNGRVRSRWRNGLSSTSGARKRRRIRRSADGSFAATLRLTRSAEQGRRRATCAALHHG